MVEQNSFGYWLRLKRKALDLSREGLAERVGCSAATIRKLEDEERRPSAQIAERLADIFNIPPNERTAFLRFARGDWKSAPSETQEKGPWQTATRASHSNLPGTTTSLIGREQDITLIYDYLLNTDIRLVTLIGPPGIGKTRLSIAAAHEALPVFPDGVFFIALAPLVNRNQLAPAIAQTLNYVPATNLSDDKQLMQGIGDKQMLLVLDNCEHLIEGAALLISELLSACSRLKIMATSRETLRVSGEWLYPIQPLTLPEETSRTNIETITGYSALALFAERARSVSPGFSLHTGNFQAVAEICARVDGLPLGIELVAARVRWMSPQALLNLMDDQWVLSADGRRAESARQKTLQDAINWSYTLLSSEEQRLFAYLSVFYGGFTRPAASRLVLHLFGDQPIHEPVASLLEKSLLQHTLDTRGETRFTMLQIIQQYASLCLKQIGTAFEAHDWHLEFYLDLVEQAEQQIHGPEQVEWLNIVENEYKNLHAALNWGITHHKTELTMRLLYALGLHWFIRGHRHDLWEFFEKVRHLPGAASYPDAYVRLLNRFGHFHWVNENFSDARVLLEESRVISEKLGAEGERNLAEALDWLGMVALNADHDDSLAKSLIQRSLEHYQKLGDEWGTANCIFHLGAIEGQWGHDDAALLLYEQCLGLYRKVGDLMLIARVNLLLELFYIQQGNEEKARQCFEQHITIDTQLQAWEHIASDMRDMGNFYRQQGKYEQADQLYENSLAICREHGINLFESLSVSGLLALERKNDALASRHFVQQLNLIWKSAEKAGISFPLAGLASVAWRTNQPERGAVLYGAAQALLAACEIPAAAPINLAVFDPYFQIGLDQLGEAGFSTLETRGRAMSMEQAVAFALEIIL